MYRLAKPVTVPWWALAMHFGSAGNPSDPKFLYDFEPDLRGQLRTVLAVYHDARIEATDTGLKLYPSLTHVPLRGAHAIPSLPPNVDSAGH